MLAMVAILTTLAMLAMLAILAMLALLAMLAMLAILAMLALLTIPAILGRRKEVLEVERVVLDNAASILRMFDYYALTSGMDQVRAVHACPVDVDAGRGEM